MEDSKIENSEEIDRAIEEHKNIETEEELKNDKENKENANEDNNNEENELNKKIEELENQNADLKDICELWRKLKILERERRKKKLTRLKERIKIYYYLF